MQTKSPPEWEGFSGDLCPREDGDLRPDRHAVLQRHQAPPALGTVYPERPARWPAEGRGRKDYIFFSASAAAPSAAALAVAAASVAVAAASVAVSDGTAVASVIASSAGISTFSAAASSPAFSELPQ